MQNIWHFLRSNALAESLLVGVLIGLLEIDGIWKWHVPSWVLPVMIFLMLFFTFCKINPMDLRLKPWHWIILTFQVGVSLLLYYAIRPFDLALAQGMFICVLMPSATAAPIIAGKLGGDIRTLTSFTLLSSASSAILVPLLFPLANPGVDMPFIDGFLMILRRVFPLLLAPFFVAWLLRVVLKRGFGKELQVKGLIAELPFWLWVGTLVILMAQMTVSLAEYEGSKSVLGAMFVGSLFTCLIQFYFGKWVGQHVDQTTRVTAGQALGQKNTTLAVWLAATYLLPVTALAPAGYIIWQNLFNSWQLHRVEKGKKN